MDGGTEERPLVGKVAEHLTVGTLAATVILFTVGRVSQIWTLTTLGIHGLVLEVPWQDHVFAGGVALVDVALSQFDRPRALSLIWLVPLCLCAGLAVARRRWGRGWRRSAAGVAAAVFGLAAVVTVGVDWGIAKARIVREQYASADRMVFQPGVEASLPPALREQNEKGTLQLVLRTPEALVLLGSDGTVFQLASSAVLVHQSSRTSAGR